MIRCNIIEVSDAGGSGYEYSREPHRRRRNQLQPRNERSTRQIVAAGVAARSSNVRIMGKS